MRIVPPEERKDSDRCCVCGKRKELIRLRDGHAVGYEWEEQLDICYQCLGEATRLIVPSL